MFEIQGTHMKWKILAGLVAVIVIAGLIFGYTQMSAERAKEAERDKPVTAESRVGRGAGGEAVVTLDEKTQQVMGLETTVLAVASLPREIKCHGRVLDASPLIALLSNVSSGRAALDASSKDFERVKALFTEGENASARAMEAAEAATKRDKISLQSAEAQLVAIWGKAMSEQPDLPGLVQSLSTLQKVAVRLDLPAGEATAQTPRSGRLVLTDGGEPISGSFLGRPTATDPQVQGQGFLFLVTNTAARLTPGQTLVGFLEMPGEALAGVNVPERAVVRASERTWVYVQISATNFVRRDLVLEHPVAAGWFVTGGVRPEDRVVTTGAQALLSEERKSEIKVGD
jgi:hypothetical protein